VQEDPHDDRNAHYLGREYHSFGRYNDAINELYRHLDLPSAKWLAERARSMRYIAKSHESLGDLEEANRWFQMATLEDPYSREALVDMAQFSLARNEYHQTIHYCEKALTLPSTGGFYLNERYALQEGPYELASVAYFYLRDRLKAIELCRKALALNPHSTLSQTNLEMMMKS
jgi:tetratricopeptide (TPR) repeat protein